MNVSHTRFPYNYVTRSKCYTSTLFPKEFQWKEENALKTLYEYIIDTKLPIASYFLRGQALKRIRIAFGLPIHMYHNISSILAS